MTTILVPTDFSDTANKARDYAIQLAQELDAQIILLNAYHIPYSGASSGTLVNLDKVALAESKKSMNNQIEYLNLNYTNISFTTLCEPGLLNDSIRRIVANKGIDLIVMGTNGASGVLANYLGSNTSELIGSIAIPLIAVPSTVTINFPRRILVANDLMESGEDKLFDTLKEIVIKTKSEVEFLFIVNEENAADTKINRLKAAQFDETFDTHYHPFYFKENDKIEDGILEYIEGKSFDLLVLTTHQRGFWEGLFHKSVSKSLVKHVSLPILVLPE
jgi:nucleotide-binding universal stress UspA family protein